jgi:hypothetical protein
MWQRLEPAMKRQLNPHPNADTRPELALHMLAGNLSMLIMNQLATMYQHVLRKQCRSADLVNNV